jgi:hypothetical protein
VAQQPSHDYRNRHTTVEELLEAVFSVQCALRLHNEDQLPLPESQQADSQLRSEKLIAEAGRSSGTQRKGIVHPWSMLRNSAVKTMTENTNLCMIVICKSVVTGCSGVQ